MHWPGPLSPLVFEVGGEPVAEALMAAALTYEMPIAEVRIRRVNGYRYQSTVPLISDPAVEARRKRSEDRLRVAMGALDELWAGTWLPHVESHLRLALAPLAPLARLRGLQPAYCWRPPEPAAAVVPSYEREVP